MKHITHDWDDGQCIRLLRNCHQSITGDGRVICVDAVLAPMGDTAGTPAKLLDCNMMVFISGKERTKSTMRGVAEVLFRTHSPCLGGDKDEPTRFDLCAAHTCRPHHTCQQQS
jgi:hypothetical protein